MLETPRCNGSPVFYSLFALLIPVLTIATSLVNWMITLIIQPSILPKLNFREKFPTHSKPW